MHSATCFESVEPSNWYIHIINGHDVKSRLPRHLRIKAAKMGKRQRLGQVSRSCWTLGSSSSLVVSPYFPPGRIHKFDHWNQLAINRHHQSSIRIINQSSPWMATFWVIHPAFRENNTVHKGSCQLIRTLWWVWLQNGPSKRRQRGDGLHQQWSTTVMNCKLLWLMIYCWWVYGWEPRFIIIPWLTTDAVVNNP